MKTGIKKPANPFPEYLVDEASGILVKNERWKDWERCQKEMMEYFGYEVCTRKEKEKKGE